MQLAMSPEVLFPLLAGAAVALTGIAVVVVLARGRRDRSDDADLTAADWTGAAATGDPASVVARQVAHTGPHRPTVADAVAVRDADTAPLPVLPGEADPAAARVVAEPAVAPDGPGVAGAAVQATPPDPAMSGPRPATAPAGSSRTVAAAVVQALAVRAAAAGETPPQTAGGPARRGDARDRLLAVLLEDPEIAIGAAEELESCRGRLGDILARLAGSGLRPDQLARLSGFSVDEVRALLAGQPSVPPTPAG